MAAAPTIPTGSESPHALSHRGCLSPWVPGAMCPGTAREHTSEEEQLVLSHARAALASTRLVTGKSQLRSALPAVKQILAAPLLKQSWRSGAMAGALSHGRPASSAPCESALSQAVRAGPVLGAQCVARAGAWALVLLVPAGQSRARTSQLPLLCHGLAAHSAPCQMQAFLGGWDGCDLPLLPWALLAVSMSRVRSGSAPSQLNLFSSVWSLTVVPSPCSHLPTGAVSWCRHHHLHSSCPTVPASAAPTAAGVPTPTPRAMTPRATTKNYDMGRRGDASGPRPRRHHSESVPMDPCAGSAAAPAA